MRYERLSIALKKTIYAGKQFHRTPPSANTAVLGSTALSRAPRRSIAVLGFRNLSGRPEEGWISTALARLCHSGVKSSEDTIAKSLEGDYRPEHLFALQQSLTAFHY